MKIALLTEKYPPAVGGLAVSAFRLARLLVGSGHIVHVFCLDSNLAAGQRNCATEDGLRVHRLGPRRRVDDTLQEWFEIIVQAQHTAAVGPPGFDLLHAYFLTQAGFIAAYAGRYLGLPAVVSARGNDLDRAVFDPGKAAHSLYALQHAAVVTVNSSDLLRKAQALAPGRRVTLIPNGVDASYFCPGQPSSELAASLGLDANPVVAFIGEARAKKGLAVLLLAAAEATKSRPFNLLLAGGVRSGEDADLVKVFQRQHPELHLVITAPISFQQMPACYQMIDLLVLPSLRDGLPNALLEGMACEKAIIATPVGGIPDAIQEGVNGRLVPPGEAQPLAEAILELLARPDERTRLGRQARQHVLREFTQAQELEANLAVYQGLLSSRSRLEAEPESNFS